MALNGIRTQIDRIENEVNTQGNLISQIATALQNKAAGSGGIDTSDATASDGDILKGKTAYAKGEKITGTMANNGSINGSIDGLNTTSYTIPTGYTSGGTVSLTNAIQTELSGVIDGSTIKTQVNNINTEVVEQTSLISQIVTALEGKAVGGGSGGESSGSNTGYGVATGSFTSDGYQNTLQINNLTFKPSNVIIEARRKVTLYGGSYNVSLIAIGNVLNSYVAHKASTTSYIIGEASSYTSINFKDNGFDLSLNGHRFGQATYYWTAIGGN